MHETASSSRCGRTKRAASRPDDGHRTACVAKALAVQAAEHRHGRAGATRRLAAVPTTRDPGLPHGRGVDGCGLYLVVSVQREYQEQADTDRNRPLRAVCVQARRLPTAGVDETRRSRRQRSSASGIPGYPHAHGRTADVDPLDRAMPGWRAGVVDCRSLLLGEGGGEFVVGADVAVVQGAAGSPGEFV